MGLECWWCGDGAVVVWWWCGDGVSQSPELPGVMSSCRRQTTVTMLRCCPCSAHEWRARAHSSGRRESSPLASESSGRAGRRRQSVRGCTVRRPRATWRSAGFSSRRAHRQQRARGMGRRASCSLRLAATWIACTSCSGTPPATRPTQLSWSMRPPFRRWWVSLSRRVHRAAPRLLCRRPRRRHRGCRLAATISR